MSLNDLTFTFKDLLLAGSIIGPLAVTFLFMKWRQNHFEKAYREDRRRMEQRIQSIEDSHQQFKGDIHQKLEENIRQLHSIELGIANLKNEFLQKLIEAIDKFRGR